VLIDLERLSSLGDTVADFLNTLPYEIDGDGEGLWSLVPTGRSFEFEGADLKEFVRISVLRILYVGGVPVRHSENGPLRWLEQKQHGTERDQIANAIIAEWQAAGGGDPPWEWLWFVSRRVLETQAFR
jgi:hypothetical protein